MKRILSTLALGAMSAMALAIHPDSVYVRPDVKNGTRDFQIAYSQDMRQWTHIHCNLFESDYGPWGSEKKLYHPVLSYDGQRFRCTFIPNPKHPQVATTESDNFVLWKPQDYPYLDDQEFKKVLEAQREASEKNVIRVPWTAVQALLDKKKIADYNARLEREDFVATAEPISRGASQVTAHITVDASRTKSISPDLVGIFFEDISHAADGGLYAELLQNRDFEYNGTDHGGWDARTAWRIEGDGIEWAVNTENPIHPNNAHYLSLFVSSTGSRLINSGWDGIAVTQGEKYDLSLFARGGGSLRVSLVADGKTVARTTLKAAADWKQVKATLTPTASATNAELVIEPLRQGRIDLDFVSLFPRKTFRGRANGLRNDLAQVIADLKPRFVRFPGGCATHGQGIDNIYHWQATIGELWERQPDFNIWGYHQSRGLGFYEYFVFCEDLGAEPLPVLAAGVPCQNSWKGGCGQQGGIPFERELQGKPSPYTYNGKPLTMESYLQELLDLIEWANGDPKTSALAALRAKAGHPKPFNLKYLGIGNEDLISDTFLERYLYLIDGVRKAHPEITVVGTVGPFWQGSDYEYGWAAAKQHQIPVVDEHYYNSPGWYFNHRDFYDSYDRNGTKVYLGEWASHGNQVSNALVEAAYMTGLERNADVVVMSSYAPLLAREGKTNWNPDLIYFNNTEVKPTANYYVQRAFGQHAGDTYVYSDMTVDYATADGRKPLLGDIARRIDRSVVVDSQTGDVMVKLVSLLPVPAQVTVHLGRELTAHNASGQAVLQQLVAPAHPGNARDWAENTSQKVAVGEDLVLTLPAFSVNVIRIGK